MALDCTEEEATSAFGYMSIFIVCFGHFMGFDDNITYRTEATRSCL